MGSCSRLVIMTQETALISFSMCWSFPDRHSKSCSFSPNASSLFYFPHRIHLHGIHHLLSCHPCPLLDIEFYKGQWSCLSSSLPALPIIYTQEVLPHAPDHLRISSYQNVSDGGNPPGHCSRSKAECLLPTAEIPVWLLSDLNNRQRFVLFFSAVIDLLSAISPE